MKPKILIIGAVAFLTLASHSFGQAPPSGQSSGSPYDYFKLGEIVQSIRNWDYYCAIAGDMKTRLDSHRAFLQKLNFNSDSLAAYDAAVNMAVTLPFAKETLYGKWNKEDQQKWDTVLIPAQNSLIDILEKDPQLAPKSAANHCFWMGYHSVTLSWTVPTELNSNGNKISRVVPLLTAATGDFAWLRDTPLAAELTPEVVDIIKTIASMKAKANDPLDGFTRADVDKLAELAKQIREAAKQQKLLNDKK